MNNMEIQRKDIIEIVRTQYEGRAVNHNPLFLKQGLVLKHQSAVSKTLATIIWVMFE
jgi:hypothetical protein